MRGERAGHAVRPVQVCGCNKDDKDSDFDGTPDCNDECPNDPKKTAVGQCGCGNEARRTVCRESEISGGVVTCVAQVDSACCSAHGIRVPHWKAQAEKRRLWLLPFVRHCWMLPFVRHGSSSLV